MLTASGHERILAICSPFDFIGEAFLRDADRYRVDAIALTDVTTCPMSRAQFLQVVAEAPTFALSFSEILADHLFDCREQLSTAYDPVKVRLAKLLLNQARRFGKALEKEGWYELQTELKHEEIASYISATRVSVSMAFTELREEGLVEGTRGYYQIHLPALEALANLEL